MSNAVRANAETTHSIRFLTPDRSVYKPQLCTLSLSGTIHSCEDTKIHLKRHYRAGHTRILNRNQYGDENRFRSNLMRLSWETKNGSMCS